MNRRNTQANIAIQSLVNSLHSLVRLGSQDNRMCPEAIREANKGIDAIVDIATAVSDYKDLSAEATPREVTPTNSQWGLARRKVESRVNSLRNDINSRLQGKMVGMTNDILALLDDHRRWVSNLTIASATL